MMMNKTRSSTLKLAKYLLMLPMFFVLIAANSAYAGVNDQTYQAPPPPPPPPPVKIAETDEVVVVVEEMPEYPGGVDAMMRFLGETIRYPFEAMTNGIQGRVICNFVIEKDGSVSDVQIVRGIDPHLDDEAIRVIEAMPKWKPGMQKEEIVRTRFTLPIVFRLTGDVDDNQKTSDNSSVPTEDIFVVVEQQPEYPDGVEAMMKFLGDSVRYPIEAQEKGIQGRVIVNFVVNKDGSITDVNVVRGVDPSIDAEAVRVIESMPKWKPGVQRGQPVNVRYTLPVSFKLDYEPLSEQQKQELQKIKDSIVEAKFPGGNDAYMKYLTNNVRYPVIAQENGIQGLVVARYRILSTGKADFIDIVEGVDPSLEKEVQRLIDQMPDCTPTTIDGEATTTVLNLPVVFRLQGEGIKSYDGPTPDNAVVVVGYGSKR